MPIPSTSGGSNQGAGDVLLRELADADALRAILDVVCQTAGMGFWLDDPREAPRAPVRLRIARHVKGGNIGIVRRENANEFGRAHPGHQFLHRRIEREFGDVERLRGR